MKRAKMDRYIETLKEKVEERLGKQPRVHGDFVYLADIIHDERHELISPTTLKRMWGSFFLPIRKHTIITAYNKKRNRATLTRFLYLFMQLAARENELFALYCCYAWKHLTFDSFEESATTCRDV